MKIVLLLSLFVCFSTILNSQTNTYHPFPHENAEWSLLYGIESFEPYDTIYYVQKFQAGGDSIILGETYIKYMSGTGVYSLFKDDSVNKKVYTLYDDGATLTDTLLYDFNLADGSSVSHSIEFLDYPDAHVTKVDSILINGNYRKRLKIEYTNAALSDSTFWIEGIGSTNGIQLGPGDVFEFPSVRKLVCYNELSDVLYQDIQDWYDCDSVLIDQNPISINHILSNAITVYPNPADDFVEIRGDSYLLNFITSARLISLNGAYSSQMKLDGNKLFFIDENLTPGIYILIIETHSNYYTFKIGKS